MGKIFRLLPVVSPILNFLTIPWTLKSSWKSLFKAARSLLLLNTRIGNKDNYHWEFIILGIPQKVIDAKIQSLIFLFIHPSSLYFHVNRIFQLDTITSSIVSIALDRTITMASIFVTRDYYAALEVESDANYPSHPTSLQETVPCSSP